MNKKTTLGTIILSVAAFVEPAMAKSVTLIPVTCSDGTPTAAVFQKQGSLLSNIGFNGGNVGPLRFWHTTITDNDAVTLLNYNGTFAQSAPQILLASTKLPKGVHVIKYHAEADTGAVCDFQTVTKV
ncbi:MAG: hypothetical protein ABL933_11110 [Methyloglobulus sp.]|nr:hypothetical protein [Methyloglobulus sp.]